MRFLFLLFFRCLFLLFAASIFNFSFPSLNSFMATAKDIVGFNSNKTPFLELDGEKLSSSSMISPTITIRENKVITLRCVVNGLSPSPASINWFISNVNVTDSSQLLINYSANNDSYDTQSLLTLQVNRDFHAQKLDCVAHHVSWSKPILSTATFNVLYEPSFSISREPGFGIPIMEGMPVSLKCVIDADPTSHAIWYKDEVPSIPSSPSFASSLSSSLSHRAGSSLEQDEEDEGDIKSALNRNEDERINNNLKGGRKTIPIALPSPGGIYTIESAKVSDTGWYRCSVDYEFGSFSSYSYYLHIRFSQAQELSDSKVSPPCSPGESSFSSIDATKLSAKMKIVLVMFAVAILVVILLENDDGIGESQLRVNGVAQLSTGTQVLKALNASLFDGDAEDSTMNQTTTGNQTVTGYESVNYNSSIGNTTQKQRSNYIDGDECWAVSSLALTILASCLLVVLIFIHLFFACSQRFSKNKHSVVIENVPASAFKTVPRTTK